MDPMKVKVLITTFKQILFHVGIHHTDMNARGHYSSATDSKTTVGCLDETLYSNAIMVSAELLGMKVKSK